MSSQEGKGKSTFHLAVKVPVTEAPHLPHEHFGLDKECHEIFNDKRPGLLFHSLSRRKPALQPSALLPGATYVSVAKEEKLIFSRLIL